MHVLLRGRSSTGHGSELQADTALSAEPTGCCIKLEGQREGIAPRQKPKSIEIQKEVIVSSFSSWNMIMDIRPLPFPFACASNISDGGLGRQE